MYVHTFNFRVQPISCPNFRPIRLVPGACPCVRVTVSPSTLECNEAGCCPGQAGCLSACSPRKCCVLMKCDKDGDDFKGADVNLGFCGTYAKFHLHTQAAGRCLSEELPHLLHSCGFRHLQGSPISWSQINRVGQQSAFCRS